MRISLNNEDLAGFISPRLRVFLSVDLIGSTEYKIKRAGDGKWPSILMGFYSDFQNKFYENWNQWEEHYQNLSTKLEQGPAPRLWKALGDELLFWKECRSDHEVCGVVQVWRKTLMDFKESWEHPDLRFKTGAWIVGSPVRNWEVAFLREAPTEDDTPYLGDGTAFNFHLLSHYYSDGNGRKIDIDFIGPSMDCGFRLLGLVDQERMILSADLAYILAGASGWWSRVFKGSTYPKLVFFLDQPQPLKGVTNNTLDYPIIWLAVQADHEEKPKRDHVRAVRELLGTKPRSVSTEELTSLLEQYLEEVEGFPEAPYICRRIDGEIELMVGDMPTAHKDAIERYRDIYLNAVRQDEEILASLQSDGEGVRKTKYEIRQSVKDVTGEIPEGK